MKESSVGRRPYAKRKRILIPLFILLFSAALYIWSSHAPIGSGLAFEGPPRAATGLSFLADISWRDADGKRQLQQSIFDQALTMISEARRLILIDMFLYNAYQGPEPEITRLISDELTAALVEQKNRYPSIQITVITDPINTVYGGTRSEQFERLKDAGIDVVLTDLADLRDSNPVYSFIWRTLIKPLGNAEGDTLPNPFGAGRVTLRSYLRMINFKANHRKVLVTDNPESGLSAMVTSANPHDGSSAHRNVALKFDGLAALDIVNAENAVLALSESATINTEDISAPIIAATSVGGTSPDVTLQVLTERRIKDEVLELLARADDDSHIDLLMFYLSDRDVIKAMIAARKRGALLRVILDVNRDAFGRQKNGVPNKPVAHELHRNGIDVRWCDTLGEQCHAKMLMVTLGAQTYLLQGSANFTRRNLDNYNLECDVVVSGKSDTPAIVSAQQHFNLLWNNEPDRRYTVDYDVYRDASITKRWMYRIMEASGLSTF